MNELTKHSQAQIIFEYRHLNLKEGDVIEVLRENSPMFEKGEQLVIIKTNNNVNWKFRSLKSNKECGFRLVSTKYPEYYNENFGWKKVEGAVKQRIYELNQFLVKSREERRALLKILQDNGYKIEPSFYNSDHYCIVTTKSGTIQSCKEINPLMPIINCKWIVPKYIEVETININGKTYIKSEYETMLSKLKPV